MKKINELDIPKKSDLEMLEEISKLLKANIAELEEGSEELYAEYEKFLERKRNTNK